MLASNGKVNETEEKKILELLKKEDVKDLKYDIALAPVWIQKIMKRALEIKENKCASVHMPEKK